MKLIVGLGNPGKKYTLTRHNIGFMFLDNYVETKNLGKFQKKFNGLYLKTKLYNQDVIFLKPQSYMNLSGIVVSDFVNYFKIDSSDIFVISDDLDLIIGNFKLKSKGSSGGHNGLKNIENMISTREYKRLKIGISNNKNLDTKDYVLSKFTKEEQEILSSLQEIVNNIIDDYFQNDFESLMSKYNSKNK